MNDNLNPAAGLVSWLLERLDEQEAETREEPIETSEQEYILADIDAKRRLIDLHHAVGVYSWQPHGDCAECSDGHEGGDTVRAPCPTLRLVAWPFTQRHGYQDEWLPKETG